MRGPPTLPGLRSGGRNRHADVDSTQQLSGAAETVFMTAPRQVIPGRTALITRRIAFGMFLLLPDEDVRAVFEYCLGVAARKYRITVHGWLVMSNHYHLVATDHDGRLPEFLAWFNRMTSRILNKKWGRNQNLWAAEQPNVVWCVDPQDAFNELLYTYRNPIADDLVDAVAAWPGSNSFLQGIGTRMIKRPAKFFSKRSKLPTEIDLSTVRIPGFEHLTDEKYVTKIARAVRHEERLARARRAASGTSVLGPEGVLAHRHTDVPKTSLPSGGLRPSIACKNKKRRIRALADLEAFRSGYAEALERFCLGDREVVFPAGTYGVRAFGALCAPPPLELVPYDEAA